jgi:hypothetical protein
MTLNLAGDQPADQGARLSDTDDRRKDVLISGLDPVVVRVRGLARPTCGELGPVLERAPGRGSGRWDMACDDGL